MNSKYKFITQSYDSNGKLFERKHKTENQMKKYIKNIPFERGIEIIFCYEITNGIKSNNPHIIDYRHI